MSNNATDLLNKRLKSTPSSKMAALAKQSASGNLTSFAGLFSVSELSDAEKKSLEILLQEHAVAQMDVSRDLRELISITSEVKAINNQAAILHGERIKKAQLILAKYRSGAFTNWLLSAYGNRQTPYNFLQYYEFCESLPKRLKPQIDLMPRQAIYTLASRSASLEAKQRIVENYRGETKSELLQRIRETFPLPSKDKRKADLGMHLFQGLEKMYDLLNRSDLRLNSAQKREALQWLEKIRRLVV